MAHAAVCMPNLAFESDITGHLRYPVDIINEQLDYRDGAIYPPETPRPRRDPERGGAGAVAAGQVTAARAPLFQPHDVRSLRDRAYDDIREAILTGALRPGERIKERDVAAQMGISTTPVKEALRRLEQDGLVVSQPRRGAVVGPLVLTPPEEILKIRAHLEGLAARFAAEKMTGREGRARGRAR